MEGVEQEGRKARKRAPDDVGTPEKGGGLRESGIIEPAPFPPGSTALGAFDPPGAGNHDGTRVVEPWPLAPTDLASDAHKALPNSDPSTTGHNAGLFCRACGHAITDALAVTEGEKTCYEGVALRGSHTWDGEDGLEQRQRRASSEARQCGPVGKAPASVRPGKRSGGPLER
ncbi:hypothetical protein LTR36_003165 [Oleoguttula mirabilis]|uniref:Uncharacterized protein n=1 Tax=Oleoguttula mirabilis TaxID=1507867 RepID=A0AAV9JX46_9PEZI|nr:hypothetical protein LTR36_003165 [Oleoguttula mirabilis]